MICDFPQAYIALPIVKMLVSAFQFKLVIFYLPLIRSNTVTITTVFPEQI